MALSEKWVLEKARVQWWGAQLDRAQDAINAARTRLEGKT